MLEFYVESSVRLRQFGSVRSASTSTGLRSGRRRDGRESTGARDSSLIAQRRRDVDDIEGIFAARAAGGEKLDWDFLDRWAAAWAIEDRLASYRTGYES